MAGRTLERRERIEIAAVGVLAVTVYGAAAVTAVVAGAWTLVLFAPALVGSVVAVRWVRRGLSARPGGTRPAGAPRP